MKKKIIVAGGRDFSNPDLLISKLDFLFGKIRSEIQIVSGGAKGADLYGEMYSSLRGHDLKVFPADWSKLGKSAGFVRNEQMAKYADFCVIFWDGKSRGTQHMINLAKKHKLPTKIVRY